MARTAESLHDDAAKLKGLRDYKNFLAGDIQVLYLTITKPNQVLNIPHMKKVSKA